MAPAQDPRDPQDQAVFRSGVALVRVDVQVMDREGRNIAGLTQADFQIFDNGQPQKIAYFARESEPLDLLLLLDVSGSMHRSLEQLAVTAQSALAPLHAGDRAGLMLFSRDAKVIEPFTPDFGRLAMRIREGVRDQSVGSGTAINSAIVSAALYLQKEPARGRRAILIVTDNQSLNYQVPDEEVLRQLFAADTVLNGMLIGKQKRPAPPRPGAYVNPDFTPSDVFKVSEQSGGEAMEASRPGEALGRMIERIRARYGMQYTAPASQSGVFHEIRVELNPRARNQYPSVVVRARKGYYAAQ